MCTGTPFAQVWWSGLRIGRFRVKWFRFDTSHVLALRIPLSLRVKRGYTQRIAYFVMLCIPLSLRVKRGYTQRIAYFVTLCTAAFPSGEAGLHLV